MSLEHLSKTQLILAALLVSFVSSIVTGIVTVSLMGQAPPTFAANVGGIIEKTVQQVVFATTTASTLEPVKPTTPPPAPSAENAIAAVQKSIIRIVLQGDVTNKTVARGVIIKSSGEAQTDTAILDPMVSYQAILWDGKRVPVTLGKIATSSPAGYLMLAASTTPYTAATLAAPKGLQLGESVVRLGSTAGLGIIAALPSSDTPSNIQADVSSSVPGTILIDLSGNVIGMTTTASLTLGQNYYTLITHN